MKKPFSFGWEKGDGGGYEIHNFEPRNWRNSNVNRRTAQLPYRSFRRVVWRGVSWAMAVRGYQLSLSSSALPPFLSLRVVPVHLDWSHVFSPMATIRTGHGPAPPRWRRLRAVVKETVVVVP